MDSKQKEWFEQLEPLMDSLSLMVMTDVPETFKDNIKPTKTGNGKIINVMLSFSFQSKEADEPVEEVIRAIDVGGLRRIKFSSRDEWTSD